MSRRSGMIRTIAAAAAACLFLAAGAAKNGDPVLYSHYKGLEAYGVTDAWALGFTGAGVKVAVIDSGIDFGTPDLQGAQARVDDPQSPYNGWPIVIDLYSLGAFQQKQFGGLSSLADTSSTDTKGLEVTGTSRSGVYHVGNHPDRMLTGFNGRAVKILVVDEGASGVYDTVYVDLNADDDFTNDKPCRRGDEIAVWDRDGDGLSDESGGLLYFIADGQNPPPFGRLLYGAEALVPKAGEVVGFHYDTSSHGTMCAGTIAARGRLVKGIAPGARLIPVLAFSNNEMELCLMASLGSDGRPASGDEADVVSRSAGFTFFNKGADELSAFLDHLTTKIAPTSSLVYAAGNEGSGYGTCSSPAGMHVITAGGISDLWWKDSTRRGDVINFSSRGPNVLGQLKPNVLGTGEFAPRVRPLATTHNGVSAWDLNGGGTSNATPHVAGVVALIYDAYRKGHGRFPTSETARDIVMSSADDINEEVFAQGAGVLNARRAVETAFGTGPGTPASAASTAPAAPVLFEPAFFATNPVEAGSTLDFAVKVTNPARKAVTFKPQRLFKTAESRLQVAAADDAFLVPIDKAALGCDLLKISSIFPLDPVHKSLVDATGYWFFLYDWKDLNHDGKYAEKLPARIEDAQPGELELLAISDWDHVITSEVRVHDPRARVSDGLVLGLKKNGDIKSRDATIIVERFAWQPWDGFEISRNEVEIRCRLRAPAESGVTQGKILVQVAGEKTRRSIPVSFATYAKEGLTAANSAEAYENLRLYGRLEGSGRFGFRDERFFPIVHKGEELASITAAWESSTSDVDLAVFGPDTMDAAKMWQHSTKPPVPLPVLPVLRDNGHTPKRVETLLGLAPATEKTLDAILADGVNILVVNKANSSGAQYGETIGVKVAPLGTRVERSAALTAKAGEAVKLAAGAAEAVLGFAAPVALDFREFSIDGKKGECLLFKPNSPYYFPSLVFDADGNGRYDENKDEVIFRESGAVTLEPADGDVVRLPYDGKYFVMEFSGDLYRFQERHAVSGESMDLRAPQKAGAYLAVLERAGNILPARVALTVVPGEPASVGVTATGRVLCGRPCELRFQVRDASGNAVKTDLEVALESGKRSEPVKIKAGEAALTVRAPEKEGPWLMKVRSRLGVADVKLDVAKGGAVEFTGLSVGADGLKAKLVNTGKAPLKASLSANPSWYVLPELAGRPEFQEFAMFYRDGYVAGYLPFAVRSEISLAAGEEKEFTLPIPRLKEFGSYAARLAYVAAVSDAASQVIAWEKTAPFSLTVSGFAPDPKVTKKIAELGEVKVKQPVSFLAEGLVSVRLGDNPALYFEPSIYGAVAVIPDAAGELRIRAEGKETMVKVAAGAAAAASGTPDTFPPDKVEGVKAVFDKGTVKVAWKPSAAGDLDHYAVYRLGGEMPRKVADVKTAEYTMKGDPWNSYNFRITAVDKSGNESKPSDPCGLVAMPPARPDKAAR